MQGDLYRVIEGGGHYEGQIEVDDGSADDLGYAQTREAQEGVSAPELQWGDHSFMINPSPTVSQEAYHRVQLHLAGPESLCEAGSFRYQYQLTLESERLTTPLDLAQADLSEGAWGITEGAATLILSLIHI